MTIFGWVNDYSEEIYPSYKIFYYNPDAFKLRVSLLKELNMLDIYGF